MNKVTEQLLKIVSDFKGEFQGAFNIRENGECAGRQSTKNIKIIPKTDAPGIEVHIAPGTRGEHVYIPACVTHSDVNDLVYNDFYVEEDADVVIVAGCGVHNDGEEEARHNGIHRFFLGRNAHVLYQEKHIGTGKGKGLKRIDPVTSAFLAAGAVLEMDTVQLRGVDSTLRKTDAVLDENARMIVRERIMTDESEYARTEFEVTLKGEDSGVDLISRSVAKGNSHHAWSDRLQSDEWRGAYYPWSS